MPSFLRAIIILSLGLSALASHAQSPVRLCAGDGSPWPPYSYFERDQQGNLIPQSYQGLAIDQLRSALAHSAIEHELFFMPWARLMHEMASPQGLCDLVWNASFSTQRAEFALFSEVQYRTQLGLFFLPINPNRSNPDWSTAARYCGVNGYNYAPFVLNTSSMVMADSIGQALRMLEAQRCQFFPSELEPIFAGGELGIYVLPDSLAHIGLGRFKEFHVMISRRHPQAEQLQQLINQWIAEHPIEFSTGI